MEERVRWNHGGVAKGHADATLTIGEFVGRERELARLTRALDSAIGGDGQVATVSGEAGIGKTRLLQELAAQAGQMGAVVLWGSCDEAQTGGNYGPFRQALDGYARDASDSALRAGLGSQAPVLARLVPRLRQRLPDLPESQTLQPDEERTRLFDAVSQCLIGISKQATLVLVLDDLHWADPDTTALLRHVVRTMPQQGSPLLVGAYRVAEVDEEAPLGEALAVLQRQPRFDPIRLVGFSAGEVGDLLCALTEPLARGATRTVVDPTVVEALRAQTRGNPLFVHALGRQLVEDGTLTCADGRWQLTRPLDEIALPDSVRQLQQRQLKRLTPEARHFLTVAAAVGQTFRFDVAAAAAELHEDHALSAVDEALAAQLILPTTSLDTYTFAHALVRQTLYELLNPSRQVRLHRRIAEGMEATYGEHAIEHAAEIAEHYERSRSLPGAERAVAHLLRAAERADSTHAHGQVVHLLRSALTLLPTGAPQRPRLLGRLAQRLAWAMQFEDAVSTAREAASLIAEREGPVAAADYVAETVAALSAAGEAPGAWALAALGIGYIGQRRDATWVTLRWVAAGQREADDPNYPGIDVETPEVLEILGVAESLSSEDRPLGIPHRSRQAALTAGCGNPIALLNGGEYRGALELCLVEATRAEGRGQINRAAMLWGCAAVTRIALGSFAAAGEAKERARMLSKRAPGRSPAAFMLATVDDDLRLALDEGWERAGEGGQTAAEPPVEYHWLAAGVRAAVARTMARIGHADPALFFLAGALPAISRGAGWAPGYTRLVCDSATTLWWLERREHCEVVERNLREKTLPLDLRAPMQDARLSLARLCALQGRCDEAAEWFDEARTVLDEQGARPLRAIVDYDEALMYARRAEQGDRERSLPLLEAALRQFRAIGMQGWIRRAEAETAAAALGTKTREAGAPVAKDAPEGDTLAARRERVVFRREGDYWTIARAGTVARLRHLRGFAYLAYLLRRPCEECHASEVAAGESGTPLGVSKDGPSIANADSGPVLDAQAKAAFRRRRGELQGELEEAESFNDAGRIAAIHRELHALAEELERAVGLGGRDRRRGSSAERARVNVTRGIVLALQRIDAEHPELGTILKRAIRTGTFCSYWPYSGISIEWDL